LKERPLAATNKFLARSNKSPDLGGATKKLLKEIDPVSDFEEPANLGD